MTRLLLFIFLFLSSAPAYAEWVKVGIDDEGQRTVYVEQKTIHRKGNQAKFLEMLDYKNVQAYQGDSFLSVKSQDEMDCAEDRFRFLGTEWFSDNMGRGKVVYSTSLHSAWEPVQPDSIMKLVWIAVCGKK